MQNTNIKFTVQDYLQLPEDGPRWELIEGDLYVAPSPTWSHQTILFNLVEIFQAINRRHNLGDLRFAPLDVHLGEATVVEPDLILISPERRHIIGPQWVHGAPDLVAEVLSPGTRERDLTLKATIYARYGVAEYWLVDGLAQTVTVLGDNRDGWQSRRVFAGDDLAQSLKFSQIALPARELFGNP